MGSYKVGHFLRHSVDALRQVLNLRDGFDFLFFSDGSTLLHSELDSLILYVASSCTL